MPIIALFLQSWQEVFLIFALGFWSARLIQMELITAVETNFSVMVYFIFGVIYNILFTYLFMKLFSKRSNL